MMHSEDIEFLKELYSNNKVSLYFFHEKYRLSPAQLGRTIRKFLEHECVVVHGDDIELTDQGRRYIIANRQELFLKEKEKHWKSVPEEMKQPPLPINELYKPKRKNIDVELFKNIEGGE